MKNKIISLSLILLLQIAFCFSSFAFSMEEDVPEEEMQKAVMAYKQGVDMYRHKAYDNALLSFEKALSYDPKMTDAYYNIAAIYVAQKKYDEAYNHIIP